MTNLKLKRIIPALCLFIFLGCGVPGGDQLPESRVVVSTDDPKSARVALTLTLTKAQGRPLVQLVSELAQPRNTGRSVRVRIC